MLRSHPAVIDVCVVGRPDPDLGEVPVAFVVGDLTQEELDRFLNERGLARYKWPERIHRLHELPLSGPGKENRRMLGEHGLALQRHRRPLFRGRTPRDAYLYPRPGGRPQGMAPDVAGPDA